MSRLAEYTEEMYNCIRCGFCQIYCPVFKVVGNEPAVARGKIELSKAVLNGTMEMTPRYGRYMMKCLLCGICTQNCPSGVKADEIIRAAREAYCSEKEPPRPMADLRGRLATSHNISGEPNENRALWASDTPGCNEAASRTRAGVVYFTGCVSSLYPAVYRIPQSFVSIMNGAGVDFALMGGEEWCCGYPLIIGGMPGDAREMIEHNIAKVKAYGATKLVTTCPSCYHAWKHDYPQIHGKDLGFDVLHSTEFMRDLILDGKLEFKAPFEQTATYHDPCDLGRKSGVFDAPREILRSIPGLTLIEMANIRENARCCGGGGNLEMNDPEVSGEVAAARVAEAVDTGAGILSTACQQCKRTLQAAVRSRKARIKVMDLTEIVLKAMGVE